nr:MAG TPA: hypothetical protein [Caudoviricetes sp.]
MLPSTAAGRNKTVSNGSERGCCSLYRKSHQIRWRLFFMPWR